MESRFFASIYGMNLTLLKRMVCNSQPVYRKSTRLKTNATEKQRRLLIMKGEDTECTRSLKDARKSFRIRTYLQSLILKLQKLEDEKTV